MTTEQSAEEHDTADKIPASTPEANKSKREVLKRTPFSKFRKVHSNFKSPLQGTDRAKVSPAEEVAELERQRERLDAEIAQLDAEGYRVDELEQHIDMLHEYNDIKDIGQLLLGRIAAHRGTTTRALYPQFGLELDD